MPELLGQGCDVIMPERGDAMSNRGRLAVMMRVLGMFEGLPGLLGSRRMLLFPVLLLRNTMGMRRNVVQFGGSLVVLVV